MKYPVGLLSFGDIPRALLVKLEHSCYWSVNLDDHVRVLKQKNHKSNENNNITKRVQIKWYRLPVLAVTQ